VDDYREQKDLYRGVIAAVSDGDVTALDSFLARDVVDHNPLPNQAPGIEGFAEWISVVPVFLPRLPRQYRDGTRRGRPGRRDG